MARPRKYSDTVREQALALFTIDGSVIASRATGVPRSTIETWARRGGIRRLGEGPEDAGERAKADTHEGDSVPRSKLGWPERRSEELERLGELVTATRRKYEAALEQGQAQKVAVYSRSIERLTHLVQTLHAAEPTGVTQQQGRQLANVVQRILTDLEIDHTDPAVADIIRARLLEASPNSGAFDQLSPSERIRRAHSVLDRIVERRRALGLELLPPEGGVMATGPVPEPTDGQSGRSAPMSTGPLPTQEDDNDDKVVEGQAAAASEDDDVADGELVDETQVLHIDTSGMYAFGSVQAMIGGPMPRNRRRQ